MKLYYAEVRKNQHLSLTRFATFNIICQDNNIIYAENEESENIIEIDINRLDQSRELNLKSEKIAYIYTLNEEYAKKFMGEQNRAILTLFNILVKYNSSIYKGIKEG